MYAITSLRPRCTHARYRARNFFWKLFLGRFIIQWMGGGWILRVLIRITYFSYFTFKILGEDIFDNDVSEDSNENHPVLQIFQKLEILLLIFKICSHMSLKQTNKNKLSPCNVTSPQKPGIPCFIILKI